MDEWATKQQRVHNLASFRQMSTVWTPKKAETARIHSTLPCLRCGVERRVHSSRVNLCRDCKEVLSAEEIALWAA